MTEMQAQFSGLDAAYSLKKIIYINSATHGYSELVIDGHMALFGQNNRGKTASLAGLKLALFPENAFTHCKRKFKFMGKDGDYSKEDSYNFYFPGYTSYIILEAENPYGVFSMVLYKARGEWQYGRFFVPVAYKTIKPIFWDESALKGEGDFVKDLKFEAVKKGLKGFKAEQVTDEKQLAQLLYTGRGGNPTEERYCLFPLKGGATQQGIEAFRQLYQLAFDIGQTDKTSLPRAVATLIDTDKSRKEERLNADFDELMLDYEKLSADRNELNRLAAHSARFESLNQQYQMFNEDKKQLNSQLNQCAVSLKEAFVALKEQMHSIEERHQTAQQSLELTQDKAKVDQVRLNQQQGQQKALEKQQAQSEKDYVQSTSLINGYPGMSLAEIVTIYDEQITQTQVLIKSLEDAQQTQKALALAIKENNEKLLEKEELTKKLDTEEPGLLEQLDQVQADILYSLNPAFSRLGKALPEDALAAIDAFTDQFELEGETVSFGGEPLQLAIRHYRLDESRKLWESQLKKCQHELDDLAVSIEDLRKALINDDDRKISIDKHKASLKDIEKEKRLILANAQLKTASDESRFELEVLEEQVAMLEESCALSNDAAQAKQADFLLVDHEKQQLLPRLLDVENWQERLDALLMRTGFQLAENFDGQLLTEVTHQTLGSLDEKAQQYQTLRQSLMHNVKALYESALPDRADAFDSIDSDKDIASKVNTLKIAFIELPQKERLLDEAVQSHNDKISNQVREIQEARGTVMRFMDKLNHEVNQHKISNLDAIRVVLNFSPRFDQLMQDIETYNLQDATLLDKGFYDRLQAFCDSFFDGKTRTLDLPQLIDSIHYEYKKNGAKQFDKKSQSGGTTSTTTALILALLLHGIRTQDTQVKIPIIVDEIGTLDSQNTLTAIETIESQGFAVFCATPEAKPALMESIKRWITIDRFTVEKPREPECHTLILEDFIESIGLIEEDKPNALLEVIS